MADELKGSMRRVAQNLATLTRERGLAPVYAMELFAAAEEEDAVRFFRGIGDILDILKGRRERDGAA